MNKTLSTICAGTRHAQMVYDRIAFEAGDEAQKALTDHIKKALAGISPAHPIFEAVNLLLEHNIRSAHLSVRAAVDNDSRNIAIGCESSLEDFRSHLLEHWAKSE
jgi:hypothetical protein